VLTGGSRIDVLAVLGISATTYEASKGVQASSGLKGKDSTGASADTGNTAATK